MIEHTLNKAVAGNYAFLIKRLDALDPTVRWQVSVKPFKSTRSTEQNDRLWALYTALGKYIGEDDPDEVHKLMGYKFLRFPKTVNGEQFWFIKSTTKLNTAEMTEYQESIERWGASLGFVWGGE